MRNSIQQQTAERKISSGSFIRSASLLSIFLFVAAAFFCTGSLGGLNGDETPSAAVEQGSFVLQDSAGEQNGSFMESADGPSTQSALRSGQALSVQTTFRTERTSPSSLHKTKKTTEVFSVECPVSPVCRKICVSPDIPGKIFIFQTLLRTSLPVRAGPCHV